MTPPSPSVPAAPGVVAPQAGAQVSPPPSSFPPRTAQGTAHALFIYDAALAIDLEHAERLLAAGTTREKIRHSRKAPPYFEYRPAPLRLTLTVEPVQLGTALGGAGFRTAATVDCRIFDFGAVVVSFRVPIDGPLERLVDLGDALFDNQALHAAARRRVDETLALIAPALRQREGITTVEDYVVYQISRVDPFPTPAAAFADDPAFFAQFLRAERVPLSAGEQADALACGISYSAGDVTLVDWNAAVVLDPDADDVRNVLEFANAELLEMRVLDDRLDRILEQAYQAVSERRPRRWLLFPSDGGELRRLAELQMDSALLYEGVNNALKLIGDQYLARVYRLAAQRFHLPERDAIIERKLRTIESIYDKLTDRQATVRMEVLEWIIIILIAVSIVLPFVVGYGGH